VAPELRREFNLPKRSALTPQPPIPSGEEEIPGFPHPTGDGKIPDFPLALGEGKGEGVSRRVLAYAPSPPNPLS